MPTVENPVAESPKAPVATPHVARIISSDSIPAGGFTPGTILADRYRVIGLLGRGGMGEVYRADDLKLGQPVALKFLPPKLADDPVRRERFFAEVRITRQLSHPNICRVYDIGEIEDRHFLSMEFIDGEDLASLLKRIGHLTNEKALDIARQLAAGLSAAHERGVLHRDLKPSNIMLDGHGRVRITDFGLAIAQEDESQAAEIAGTPAYMAPEQLAGKGATVRSDIYSLGLILYEIYTGKKAFTAKTLAELREQKETQTPRAPSEIRGGIDPVVERLIQRCMERDPNARPASVAQLAQALPGGDPLAAALAAGETPSPEMVAASGSKEGLRPAVAWGILVFIIAGTLASLSMTDRIFLYRRISFAKSPEALVERSRLFLSKAGYSGGFADSAYGFMGNPDLMRYIEDSYKTADRWKNLNSKAILFWYRQSPDQLEVPISAQGSAISYNNPSMRSPGEVCVALDTEGRLVSFRAVPPAVGSGKGAGDADWDIFFAEAGLDISQWRPAEAKHNPPFYADTRAAWKTSLPNRPGDPMGIEAAAIQGKAVSFEILYPWTKALQPAQQAASQPIKPVIAVLFFLAIFAGALFFAFRNLRRGRGDRRSATRLALSIMGLIMISWALGAHHVQTSWEGTQIFLLLSISLAVGGIFWVLYIAIEPFVRRRWPLILVSWNRILSGKWRDPLVARDAFIGCAFGILILIIFYSHWLVPTQLNRAELMPPMAFVAATVLGTNRFIAAFLDVIISAAGAGLSIISILFLLRILLRNQKAAIAAGIVINALIDGGTRFNIWSFGIFLVIYCIAYFVLLRFGLVALMFNFFIAYMFMRFPIVLETSAWYSGVGYSALALIAVVVFYAFRTSLGGRPLISAPGFDD